MGRQKKGREKLVIENRCGPPVKHDTKASPLSTVTLAMQGPFQHHGSAGKFSLKVFAQTDSPS